MSLQSITYTAEPIQLFHTNDLKEDRDRLGFLHQLVESYQSKETMSWPLDTAQASNTSLAQGIFSTWSLFRWVSPGFPD